MLKVYKATRKKVVEAGQEVILCTLVEASVPSPKKIWITTSPYAIKRFQ